jgi:putative sterol carrier protein
VTGNVTLEDDATGELETSAGMLKEVRVEGGDMEAMVMVSDGLADCWEDD